MGHFISLFYKVCKTLDAIKRVGRGAAGFEAKLSITDMWIKDG